MKNLKVKITYKVSALINGSWGCVTKVRVYPLSEMAKFVTLGDVESHKISTGLVDRKTGEDIFDGDLINVFDWGKNTKDIICTGHIEWSEEEGKWSIDHFPGDNYDLFSKAGIELVRV